MIYKIVLFPDPILKKISQYVERIDENIKEFCGNLIETMESKPYGVGISAPQVGRLLRIIVVDVSKHKRGRWNNHGRLLMINPKITHREGEQVGREGCMSVPDYFGIVTRARKIRVEYTDIEGESRVIETKGYESVAIQHEIDHLDGYLFLDRITSLKRDLYRRDSK